MKSPRFISNPCGQDEKGPRAVRISFAVVALMMSGCSPSLRTANQVLPSLDLKAFDCQDTERSDVLEDIAAAKAETIEWMKLNGFQIAESDLPHSAELYCSRDAMRNGLAAAFGISPDDVPAAFGGTVQGDRIYLVSEKLYRENYAELYGMDSWRENEYRMLAKHELIHRAHEAVAIAEFGTADAMGPAWIFEGIAIEAAGQFADPAGEGGEMTLAEFNDFLKKDAAGELKKPIYPQYRRTYDFIEKMVSNKWIVENAGKEDFMEILREKLEAKNEGAH